MGLMPVTDSMFMLPETREQPMHVGGLQVFQLPEGAGPDWLHEVYARSVQVTDVAPAFRRKAYRGPLTLGQWAWGTDRALDLEHHVRHSALPAPGRVRELFALVSRLHATLLDRERPLWEAHLIEGLEGGRFAVYTKIHHAMMDGVTANRLLQSSLSTSPDEPTTLPWQTRPSAGKRRTPSGPGLGALPGLAVALAGDALTLPPRLLSIAAHAVRDQAVALPGQAPRSMLNGSISASRRFAGDSWSMARIRAVARAADATVNDVVVAMCSSALRDYLLGLDALPDAPLIAMVPVSLRDKDAPDAAGNAVGTILCNLATDQADPQARLLAVRDSMRHGKAGLKGLSAVQVSALSAVVMAPLLLNGLVGLHKATRPPFNLVISNVPGPTEPLYWNGARMEGSYPLSIPLQGQALNMTITSYAGEVQFGLVGCRRTVPHLQRLLVGLEDGLAALESAFAVRA